MSFPTLCTQLKLVFNQGWRGNLRIPYSAWAKGGICIMVPVILSGCFQGPEQTQELEPVEKTKVSVPVKPTEPLSAEACAAKIEETLESRRQAVNDLPNPPCGDEMTAEHLKWYEVIESLTETELEFPCMDAALRETYGVEEGSDVVVDDHALSPEMAYVSFGAVSGAVCRKPYIAVARDTKRSLEKVVREPGFDSVSEVRLPQSFDVVQVIGGDYSNLSGRPELEPYNETTIWTFCRLPDGTFFSILIDNRIYDGPGGLELLRSRVAQADEWTGDDSCPADCPCIIYSAYRAAIPLHMIFSRHLREVFPNWECWLRSFLCQFRWL